jgi:type IV pilus assembly protein PilN
MVRINLLPIRQRLRRRELIQFGIFSAAVLAGAFLIMAGCWLYMDWVLTGLKNDEARLRVELDKLIAANKEIEKLKQEITRLQKQVATIKDLTQKRDNPAKFLSAVSMAIPDEVWVDNISKTGRSFSLNGTGVDNTLVVNFVQRLQDIKKDFSKRNPWRNKDDPNDEPFFTDVKLLQIVAQAQSGSGGSGLGVMQFKIVGNLK